MAKGVSHFTISTVATTLMENLIVGSSHHALIISPRIKFAQARRYFSHKDHVGNYQHCNCY